MRATSHRYDDPSAGYTLVELLVALTLLGFIAVFLSGTFRFGARAWDASEQAIDRIGQVDAVQNLLRRELSQAILLSFVRAAAEPEAVFAGTVDQVRFAAPLSIHREDAGLYVIELGVNDAASQGDLMLRWQVFRPDRSAGDPPTADPVVLLRDVSGIRFAYFGRLGEEIDADWHTEWRDVAALPDLIRVDVEFPDSDSRHWPSFVVAPKLNKVPQP